MVSLAPLIAYLGLGGALCVAAVVQKPARLRTRTFVPTAVFIAVAWLPLFLMFLLRGDDSEPADCGRCRGAGSYMIGPQPHDRRVCPDCRGTGDKRAI